MNNDKKVTAYIEKATREQSLVLEKLRQLIHESATKVTEKIKWSFPVFANDGKDFCYFRFSKNHITLGFYNFEKISNSKNLLEGTGNTLRHIKITVLDEKLQGIISGWLKQIL